MFKSAPIRKFWLLVTASLCLSLATLAQAPQVSVPRILGNHVIMGKDLGATLRSLAAWDSQSAT
jgi:hypothetical protein